MVQLEKILPFLFWPGFSSYWNQKQYKGKEKHGFETKNENCQYWVFHSFKECPAFSKVFPLRQSDFLSEVGFSHERKIWEVKNPQNLNQGDNKISTSEVYTDKNNYPYQATLRKRIEGIHYSAALKRISAVSQLHWDWDQSIRIFSLGFTTVVVLLVRISNVIYQQVRSRGRTNLAPSYNLLTKVARSALFSVPIRSVKNTKTWQVNK